jgi:hypothetical protein
MRRPLRFTSFRDRSLLLVFVAAFIGIGCGGGGSSSNQSQSDPAGLPPLSPPAQSNSYTGTDGAGDEWQVSIDHSSNGFTAVDSTNPGAGTALGSIVEELNFLGLSQTNISPPFQPFGFALEIPGRVLLLRPGNNATPLAALAPGSCLDINGDVTFQFVTLPDPNWAVNNATAYGNVQVSTSGATWNFSSFRQFTLAGSANQSGITLPPGSCSSTDGTINIPSGSGRSASTTLEVGPSGFFVAHQLVSSGPRGTTTGAVGVIVPAGPLNTASIAAASYVGFVDEPGLAAAGQPTTQMASFGGSITGAGCQTSPPPSSMCGGVFSGDNLGNLKQANTDTTISLGAEDSVNFGLYRSATVTIPDPGGSPGACVPPGVAGTDSQNNPTCTVPAVAVVGNPEGNFAIFLIAQDMVNNSPMVIYLLQR